MDKPLSERVAEVLALADSHGFGWMPEIQLLREQQAENEKLLLGWVSEQGQRSDAKWKLEQMTLERDRLRAEIEALRAEIQWALDDAVNGQIRDAGMIKLRRVARSQP